MNRRVSRLVAGWRTGLSRPVLILQAGNALNYFGYGLVLPFEIIYLHQIRGFSTSTAGLVLAATMGTSAIVTPPTGALLDRYSAKAIVVAGSLASALGYAGFAFVEHPWQAFACSVVSGAGLGAAGTANRTLVVRLVTPEQRAAAFALNRVAGNFGIGLGATVAGFVVAAAPGLRTFQILYVFDAVTYAGFALIVLAAVPSPRAVTVAATDADGTGFRAVARDRLFLTVIAANIVLVVVGHTLFSNILPPFAMAHTPVGPAGIGIIVLVNTSFIVIAQIPAVRVVARMRRTHAFALASALFAVSLLAVLPATLIHSALAATSLLVGVAIVFALGEIAHILVLGPLVADMAPAHLLGRYLSLYSLTFTLSLAIGPAIGGLLLKTAPDAIWWGGAVAAVLAGTVLLRLGDRIPDPLHEAPVTRHGLRVRLERSSVGGRSPGGRLTGSSIIHELGDPDGFAVVFHNGTPCSRLMPEWWDAPARERGLRMIGIDRPGYGNAPAEPNRSLRSVVEATAALMDDLGVDRFAVIGVSGGGPYALACGAFLPDRVVAVISGAGSSGFDEAVDGAGMEDEELDADPRAGAAADGGGAAGAGALLRPRGREPAQR